MDSDLKKIMEMGDYSMDLLAEISKDISNLSQATYHIKNDLIQIDKKLDRARYKGLNVSKVEMQFLEFRKVVIMRNIRAKIVKVKEESFRKEFDLSSIDFEYEALKKELTEVSIKDKDYLDTYFVEIDEVNKELKDLITRNKLKLMIEDVSDQTTTSIYTLDQVTNEFMKAKMDGIYVDDLEEMILG